MSKKQVGILGGTFDPPHLSHINIAKKATEHFDEVWVMPCYSHTFQKQMSPPYHRIAMCELAFRNIPKIKVSFFEVYHKLDKGTYETLLKLREEFPDFDFFFIIGQDNANNFDKWKNADKLKKLVPFFVYQRFGFPSLEWYHQKPHKFFTGWDDESARSSTVIREKIRRGETTADILPVVASFISNHKLYVE